MSVKKPVGRPKGSGSLYTPEIADAVVERLEQGIPLAHVCREGGMPSLRSVYDWIDANPEFSARIARARRTGHDVIATDALTIADELPPTTAMGSTDTGFVAWQKNRVWTRLQLLAKWDPKRYGEKLAVGGAADLPPISSNVTVDAAESYKRLLGGQE